MDLSLSEELIALTIGRDVLSYLQNQSLAREAQCEAVHLLEEIRCILDNDTLDDPECFYKIEAIVSAFHAHGIDTTRHDFG